MSRIKSLNQRLTIESRILFAFGGLNLKEVAEKLGVEYTTFWNYVQGRTKFPPLVLERIGRKTGISLNWLLSGDGDEWTVESKRFSEKDLAKRVSQLDWKTFGGYVFVYELAKINMEFRGMLKEGVYDRAKEQSESVNLIMEILGEEADEAHAKLVRTRMYHYLESETGPLPENFFPVDMILEGNHPREIMESWFAAEGRRYPEDYGVVFFQGWKSYSNEEKLDAIIDAKKVLDRTLKNK